MGRWYEIARYENHFERGMTDVTATYTLLPDGKIRVENEGYKGGVHKKAPVVRNNRTLKIIPEN